MVRHTHTHTFRRPPACLCSQIHTRADTPTYTQTDSYFSANTVTLLTSLVLVLLVCRLDIKVRTHAEHTVPNTLILTVRRQYISDDHCFLPLSIELCLFYKVAQFFSIFYVSTLCPCLSVSLSLCPPCLPVLSATLSPCPLSFPVSLSTLSLCPSCLSVLSVSLGARRHGDKRVRDKEKKPI